MATPGTPNGTPGLPNAGATNTKQPGNEPKPNTANTAQNGAKGKASPAQQTKTNSANTAQNGAKGKASPAQQTKTNSANTAQNGAQGKASPAQQTKVNGANTAQNGAKGKASPAQQSKMSGANTAQNGAKGKANPAQKPKTNGGQQPQSKGGNKPQTHEGGSSKRYPKPNTNPNGDNAARQGRGKRGGKKVREARAAYLRLGGNPNMYPPASNGGALLNPTNTVQANPVHPLQNVSKNNAAPHDKGGVMAAEGGAKLHENTGSQGNIAPKPHEATKAHHPETMSTIHSFPQTVPIVKMPAKDTTGNQGVESFRVRMEQLSLLRKPSINDQLNELNTAPLFSYSVLERARALGGQNSPNPFTQYGLLAGDAEILNGGLNEDPRIFYNVATPASAFICGSQGSGKSHTLSCILENCLIKSDKLGQLPRPLTGIVFHYDNYASDSHVAPCEAAYLGSNPAIKVRVLCAPTNLAVVKESYKKLNNVRVEALRLDQGDLNTKRMLELMAFDGSGRQPLYVQVIQRILREMRIEQQETYTSFNYVRFANTLRQERLMPEQERALNQRLDALESFMVRGQVNVQPGQYAGVGTNWWPKAGELIIVDLTCPCVTAPTACALFNVCLSIFLEQKSKVGRVIALDEAHRYMGDSAESEILTESLLAAIRFQRHLGARILVSTQEPTISPKLLDLCSITIVHRFSSPAWLSMLTKHLAGISQVAKVTNGADASDEKDAARGTLSGIPISTEDPILHLFSQIVELRTGEALIFAPNAIMGFKDQDLPGPNTGLVPKKLAQHVLRVIVRSRITEDGGKSIMAT